MTQKIAIISGKGGVGKTTITANLGTLLSLRGINCEVVDANIGVPNLGIHLNAPKIQYEIRDVLLGKANLGDAGFQNEDGLKILSANIAKRPQHKNLTLTNLSNILSHSKTDYVIMDSPPGVNQESDEVFNACDSLIIITTPDLPAVTASIELIENARNHNKKITGLVINRVAGKPYELNPSEIAKRCNINILGIIPEDALIPESIALRIPLVKYAPNSKAAIAFQDVATLVQDKPLTKRSKTKRTIIAFIAFLQNIFS